MKNYEGTCLRQILLVHGLLLGSLLLGCGELEIAPGDETDKGDISGITFRLSAACDILLGSMSGHLDPRAVQELTNLASLSLNQQDQILSQIGVSVIDGLEYSYRVDDLQLAVCVGGYVAINAALEAMTMSIAGYGYTLDQYGFFLALAIAPSQAEAQAKADKLAALLPNDQEVAPMVYQYGDQYYVLHNSCALAFSAQLALDITRLITARAALLTELWQSTGAYDPETKMGTLSATIALVPRSLQTLDPAACLPDVR